jgi:hypothetical protein
MRDGCPSRAGPDARLAQAAIGVNARVDQLHALSDPLCGAGAGERVNTATIELAEGVPAALAILVNGIQLGVRRESRLALDPAVSSGSVRRSQAFEHRALEPEGDDRLVRRKRRRLRHGQPDPLANRKRFAQPRFPVLPTANSNIFARYGENVERDEPEPRSRRPDR